MPPRDHSLAVDVQESFARACGMSEPLVIRTTNRATGASQLHEIGQPYTFIGRARSMGVRLDDPTVSQCHAYLQVVGGVPYCVDLGSRTGLAWDDDASQVRGWVRPGQALRVGAFDLHIVEPATESVPPSADGVGGDRPAVLEVYGPEGGSAGRHPVAQPVTLVGRHPNCDLRVMGETAPYFQCALVATNDGLWCVDIWSNEGTRLNGRGTRLSRVHDSDLIEIGRTSVVVRNAPAAASEPAADPVAEALAAIPATVAESVSEALAPFREAMGQFLQCMSDSGQALVAMQQESAGAAAEQTRQVQELARELKGLREEVVQQREADQTSGATHRVAAMPERVAEVVSDALAPFREAMELFHQKTAGTDQALAAIQQASTGAASEQVRQVQEMARELKELRADLERRNEAAQAFTATEQVAAVPENLTESVSGALAPFREAMEQFLRSTADSGQALAAMQQEGAGAAAEQTRQVQELARELKELRADVERRTEAEQAFAATQREQSAALAEQLRQVQELIRGLREDVGRLRVAPPVPPPPTAVEPTPTPATTSPPAPRAAQPRQAETAINTQTWSLDRLAMTVQPQVGGVARAEQPQRPMAAPAGEARRPEPERANGPSAEKRRAEIEMANEILLSVLNARRADLGPDHPDTLATLTDLALGYRDAGQWDRVVPLLEDALRLQTAKNGPDHPDTLTATGNMVAAYLETNKFDQALPLLTTYAGKMRGTLGADSPRFAGFLAVTAYDLLAARQYAAAEPYLRECLNIMEGRQPDSWLASQAKALIGGSLLGQRRYADAEPLLLAGYQGMKRMERTVPPQGKVRIREAADWLAALYAASGRPEEAARWRSEAAHIAGTLPATGKEATPA
ncbi:MAG TPA: tetratricopeptide repeat protein [Fimbriiglobus sp.]|jgi:pSer/pThr/pTyr-binding forkhead associated (FHA) protein|nr:tetratricopeptide repeat protein [Fimbriiglobus sp.]